MTPLGNERCTSFLNTPSVQDIPAKFQGTSHIPPFKTKEDKLSRQGTNFSATTPSRGRPPPHRAVSGPKQLIFVLFFLAWTLTRKSFLWFKVGTVRPPHWVTQKWLKEVDHWGGLQTQKVNLCALFLRSERPFTGVSGPSGAKIAKKVSKRVFLGVCKKSPPKYPKKSKMTSKSPILAYSWLFRVFSGAFLESPKTTLFETFWGVFGRGGPGDSCKWSLGSLCSFSLPEPWHLLLLFLSAERLMQNHGGARLTCY